MAKLQTELTDDDFLKLSVKEQNLSLFRVLCLINREGCEWGKKRGKGVAKKSYAVGAIAGAIGGFVAVAAKKILL